MKKIENWLIALLLVGCLFFFCWRMFLLDRVVETRFFSKGIELPDTVLKVEAGQVSMSVLPGGLRMVYYYDSGECMECCVYHVYELKSMFKQKEFVTIPLFSPKQENVADVISDLCQRGYDFPVYVMLETSKEFTRSIPDNVKYHNFLLGKDDIPVFIGDPVHSAEDAERFELFIKKLRVL